MAPMFHVNAWGMPFSAALARASLVLPGNDLSARALSKLIHQERVTVAAGVPTIWQGILDEARRSDADVSSLRLVVTGRVPCRAQ
jgi:fatty-acyl-CoA synthase